jgi:tyrosine-protein phosphatase YwqE
MAFFGLFGKKKEPLVPLRELGLKCDMHSHLIPGVDDGSPSAKDSLNLIAGLGRMGYKKLIITPHFMTGFYNNTADGVTRSLEILNEGIARQEPEISLEVAAEYYIDYDFMHDLGSKPMLTFGNKMLLFECSFTNQHRNFDETVFEMQINGYKPVLAHPERYTYWHGATRLMQEFHDRGILFQLNILSVIGAYSPSVNKAAMALIDNGLVDFIGTDLHNPNQLAVIENAMIPVSLFEKLKSLNLLNNSLL